MGTGLRVVWPRPRHTEIERFEIAAPGPGEVRIVTKWTLVSPGTERGWYAGRRAFPFPGVGFPFHPGYSLTGVVSEVGEGVPMAVGTQVFTARDGYGCHASSVTIDADLAFAVPDDLDLCEVTFFTLADTAIGAVRRARIELGESCAVIGLGPVGLLAVMSSKAAGADPVVGVDTDPMRRELALRLGADEVVAPDDLPSGQMNVAIEFADGSDAAIASAIDLVCRFGRVIAASRTAGPTTLDLVEGLLMKNAAFIHFHVLARPAHESRPGIWTMRDQWGAFVKLLRRRALTPADLISHVVAPADLPSVYDGLLTPGAQPLGVMVDWEST